MIESKFFKITWYEKDKPSKNVIVYDHWHSVDVDVRALLLSPTCVAFYVTTHNSIPKEG